MKSVRELHGNTKDKQLNLEKLRDDLENDRIVPLRLQRNIVDRRYKNDLRRPYPLSVSDVSFSESNGVTSQYYPCPMLDEFEQKILEDHRPCSSSHSQRKRRLRYFSRVIWTYSR